jgi:phage FluMu protein Com
MKYRCAKCKRLYNRDNDKAWIKSYCSKMGIITRLMRYKEKAEAKLKEKNT